MSDDIGAWKSQRNSIRLGPELWRATVSRHGQEIIQLASATPLLLDPDGVLTTNIRPCCIGYGRNHRAYIRGNYK